jgi:starch phosphorylase
MSRLKELSGDGAFLDDLMAIKRENKERLASYVSGVCHVDLNPDSLFDIQVKRLHEYKRQLLNIFHVIHQYFSIKKNPKQDICPRSYLFAAKAAPGYRRAKLIIKLVNDLAATINNDPDVADRIKIVFIPNYCVSLAEKIIPAADISEQISTAGKEASGTGNMKFMINGAVTLGTLDGANIEIAEEAGEENEIIFGLTAGEIDELKHRASYQPARVVEESPDLKRVLNSLVDGSFNSQDIYRELYDSLMYGVDGSRPDRYFVLKDFAAYVEAQSRAEALYRDTDRWKQMMLANIASSGKFSSDRTMAEYASEIWKIGPAENQS